MWKLSEIEILKQKQKKVTAVTWSRTGDLQIRRPKLYHYATLVTLPILLSEQDWLTWKLPLWPPPPYVSLPGISLRQIGLTKFQYFSIIFGTISSGPSQWWFFMYTEAFSPLAPLPFTPSPYIRYHPKIWRKYEYFPWFLTPKVLEPLYNWILYIHKLFLLSPDPPVLPFPLPLALILGIALESKENMDIMLFDT